MLQALRSSSRLPGSRPVAARAAASSPQGDFARAEDRFLATRELAKAQAELAAMRQAQGQMALKESGAFQKRLAAADARMGALRTLAKAPAAPQATLLRNPQGAAQLAKGGGLLGSLRAPKLDAAQQSPQWKGLEARAKAAAQDAWSASGPSGRAALSRLANKGLSEGAWLQLGALAKADLAQGIGRGDLLDQLAIQLDDPATITQGDKAVCAAAAIQMRLALLKPEAYLRWVAALAAPKGVADLGAGHVLRREDDWQSSDGGRAIPDRLLQPALMELGNGAADYDNRRDLDRMPDGSTRPPGLDGVALASLLGRVAGEGAFKALGPAYAPSLPSASADAFDGLISSPADFLAFLADPQVVDAQAQDAMLAALSGELKQGRPAIAIVVARMAKDSLAHHAVVVQAMDRSSVRYLNPWGQEESLPIAEFRRALVAAIAQ